MKLMKSKWMLAAIVAMGTFASTATADARLSCAMKGTWVEGNDDFLFLAAYVSKDGPDSFAGKYVNPGQAEADVVGQADRGTWTILLKYTDAGHRNMIKKLIGRGTRDRVRNEIVIEGDYKTFLGTSDLKKDGRFRIAGKCK